MKITKVVRIIRAQGWDENSLHMNVSLEKSVREFVKRWKPINDLTESEMAQEYLEANPEKDERP